MLAAKMVGLAVGTAELDALRYQLLPWGAVGCRTCI